MKTHNHSHQTTLGKIHEQMKAQVTYLSIGDVDAQVNVPEAATTNLPHQPVFSPNHELPTPNYPRRHGWQSSGLRAAALRGSSEGEEVGGREREREKRVPAATRVSAGRTEPPSCFFLISRSNTAFWELLDALQRGTRPLRVPRVSRGRGRQGNGGKSVKKEEVTSTSLSPFLGTIRARTSASSSSSCVL